MEFTLSKNCPGNTVLTDGGQAVYQVKTPFRFRNKATTISRVEPNYTDDKDSGLSDVKPLACIHWHCISSSTMDYRGAAHLMKDYLVKRGIFSLCRSFTASDGCSYKWVVIVGFGCTFRLESNDESQTLIARFHRSNLGIIGKRRKASLEILPAGQQIVDDIVVTFLYLNKLRKERERLLSAGGGGAAINFFAL